VLDKLHRFVDALPTPDVAVSLFDLPDQRRAAARLIEELRSFTATTEFVCGLEPLEVALLVDGEYRSAIELGNRGRVPLDGVPDSDRARLAAPMAELLRRLGGEHVSAFTVD